MMNERSWTHCICEDCWNARNPERPVAKYRGGNKETCCFCLRGTDSGLYVRADPATTKCGKEAQP